MNSSLVQILFSSRGGWIKLKDNSINKIVGYILNLKDPSSELYALFIYMWNIQGLKKNSFKKHEKLKGMFICINYKKKSQSLKRVANWWWPHK